MVEEIDRIKSLYSLFEKIDDYLKFPAVEGLVPINPHNQDLSFDP
jgi:hypothetical protein